MVNTFPIITSMIILSWNYRGAASSAFCRTLKEFVGMHKPNVVILLETRCSGETAERTIRNCGFDHWHIKEAVGYSGGIWVMWKDPDLVINVIESKLQYDHMKVRSRDEKEWLLTAVYASPHENKRRELWNELKGVGGRMTEDWLMVGDFNKISDPSEKKGGGRVDTNACRRFKNWINECAMIDLGAVENRFT
ncbi:uncharacterized protein [Arachis hypogaea]|uniref:uncharacterized protein n=1 Tax=Arachis hypogaea TaxID=3818 RepID=UPI003B2196F9